MSNAQQTLGEYETKRCTACGQDIRLKSTDSRRLVVTCACEQRFVKMKQAKPLNWD
jgi:hypothetical protein